MKASALSILILTLLTGFSELYASIPLVEALRQKKVSVKIGTYKPADNGYHPGYFSKCMQYVLTNLTAAPLELSEAAGRFLLPDDSNLQRMMTTADVQFALKAGEVKTVHLYAMCTEANDGSPLQASNFEYGSAATGMLKKLADFIDDRKFQNEAAQSAVWAITNDYSPYSIYDSDTAIMNSLRRYVCQLKNITYDPEVARVKNETPLMRYITGTFTFSIYKQQQVDLVVFTDDNKLVKNVLKNQTYAAGTHTVTYDVSIPVGDPVQPPSLLIMFYLDGKLLAHRKHSFSAQR